jgi:hypothetical protein
MSAAIDYPRLAADLLSAEASDVEIRVTLAVAALHGQELSVRDIARAAKISLPGAQTGIRRAVANNRLRQTQVRTNAQAKSEQLPRCRYEVAEGYLCNFVTQGPITLDESQEARNPLSEPMQQNYIGGQSDPDLCNDVAQAMQDSDIGSADSESVDTRENGTLISELSKPPLTPFEEGADAPTPPETPETADGIYHGLTNRHLPNEIRPTWESVLAKHGADRMRDVVVCWRAAGFSPTNHKGQIDWMRKGVPVKHRLDSDATYEAREAAEAARPPARSTHESAPDAAARRLREQKALLTGPDDRGDFDADELGFPSAAGRHANVVGHDRFVDARTRRGA